MSDFGFTREEHDAVAVGVIIIQGGYFAVNTRELTDGDCADTPVKAYR